jgi:hypothetical protein
LSWSVAYVFFLILIHLRAVIVELCTAVVAGRFAAGYVL